jgi:hypothetical protein
LVPARCRDKAARGRQGRFHVMGPFSFRPAKTYFFGGDRLSTKRGRGKLVVGLGRLGVGGLLVFGQLVALGLGLTCQLALFGGELFGGGPREPIRGPQTGLQFSVLWGAFF